MYLGELNPRVTGAELDDQRDRRRLRRHAAVPLPPARVPGRRLRDRRRRAQRALGAAEPSTSGRSSSSRRPTSGRAASRRRRSRGSGGCRPTRTIRFARRDTDWHTIADEDRGVLPADCRRRRLPLPGADLGILVTRGNLMDDDGELTDRAHRGSPGSKAVPRRAGQIPRLCPSRTPSRSRCCAGDRDPVRSRRGAGAGRPLAGAVRPPVARLPGLVPARGRNRRTGYADSRPVPARHAELVPASTRVDLRGGGDVAARCSSVWRPPSYLSGCSQAVLAAGNPILARNYDYAPSPSRG